ncbi:hypothetical protein GCK32_018606, partial [Trichostrongylus colubriformis]
MRLPVLIFTLVCTATALTCYEGTLEGLSNNSRTEVKHCSGISNYCIQKIDRKKNQIRRECSSFTDEHNMEEKCPMSGCHWQSKHETYCCCQFDHCNEWKSDNVLALREGRGRLPPIVQGYNQKHFFIRRFLRHFC